MPCSSEALQELVAEHWRGQHFCAVNSLVLPSLPARPQHANLSAGAGPSAAAVSSVLSAKEQVLLAPSFQDARSWHMGEEVCWG